MSTMRGRRNPSLFQTFPGVYSRIPQILAGHNLEGGGQDKIQNSSPHTSNNRAVVVVVAEKIRGARIHRAKDFQTSGWQFGKQDVQYAWRELSRETGNAWERVGFLSFRSGTFSDCSPSFILNSEACFCRPFQPRHRSHRRGS